MTKSNSITFIVIEPAPGDELLHQLYRYLRADDNISSDSFDWETLKTKTTPLFHRHLRACTRDISPKLRQRAYTLLFHLYPAEFNRFVLTQYGVEDAYTNKLNLLRLMVMRWQPAFERLMVPAYAEAHAARATLHASIASQWERDVIYGLIKCVLPPAVDLLFELMNGDHWNPILNGLMPRQDTQERLIAYLKNALKTQAGMADTQIKKYIDSLYKLGVTDLDGYLTRYLSEKTDDYSFDWALKYLREKDVDALEIRLRNGILSHERYSVVVSHSNLKGLAAALYSTGDDQAMLRVTEFALGRMTRSNNFHWNSLWPTFVEITSEFKRPVVVEYLFKQLGCDPRNHAALKHLATFGQLAADVTAPYLFNTSDENSWKASILILGYIDPAISRPILLPLLANPDYQDAPARIWVLAGLAQHPDDLVMGLIFVEAKENPSPHVRKEAKKLLMPTTSAE